MKRTLIAIALLSLPAAAAKNGLDTARIEQLTGVKGKWNEKEGVFKVEMPRSDLAVTTAGTKMIPPLGLNGESNKGVYKITIGREVKMAGHSMGNAMGVNTWAAFAGSDDQAIVDGDFAMLESELQGVLKALRKAGIDIVAIHQHMTGETPRMLFLHYWGIGRTEDLARGLKDALGQTRS